MKITPLQFGTKSLKLCLYGEFTKEYVPELERVLSGADAAAQVCVLDLANVTLVDREAMVFLCSAMSKNILIENCPKYVLRWIKKERH